MRVPSRSTSLAVLVALGLTLSLGLAPGALAGASAPAPSPRIKVTQNYSEILDAWIHCSGTGVHTEIHHYRRFDLSGDHAAAKGFTVSQVVVGVYSATSSDGSLPGSIVVSAIDKADPLLLANLEHLATVPVNYDTVADGDLLAAPVSAVVPAGKDMVLEAAVTSGTSGESFKFGGNPDSETAEDYVRAPACGQSQPTSMDTVAPNFNTVIFARGKAIDCLQAEADPAAAPALAALAEAEKKLKKAKKKLRKAKSDLKKAEQAGNDDAIDKAKAKVKKATKKVKKAKAKVKEAKAVPAVRKIFVECAQPRLGPPVRPAGRKPARPEVTGPFSLSTSGS